MRQFCHRCASAHPVLGRPMQWCPRCGGVLSAPTTQRLVTRRWVAKPPPRAAAPKPRQRDLGPTPRYHSTPSWGLPRTPWKSTTVPKPPTAHERMSAHAGTARPLLIGAATALVLAALAELWRYLLLLRSRTELLPAGTVRISDSLVITAGVLAPVVVVVAVVTCTLWLIRARQTAAARLGRRDARSARAQVLAVVVPGWNLVMPGVLLTELERDTKAAGPSRLLRAWWLGWVVSVALAVGVWLLRLRHTVQAQADGVLLAALSDLVAAGTVVLTLLLVVRCTEALGGATVRARSSSKRWVASVPTAPQARCRA